MVILIISGGSLVLTDFEMIKNTMSNAGIGTGFPSSVLSSDITRMTTKVLTFAANKCIPFKMGVYICGNQVGDV